MQKFSRLRLALLPIYFFISLISSCSSDAKNITSIDSEESFVCGETSTGQLATLANTTRGKIPLIIWQSPYFSDSGWTPKDRCIAVTDRFIEYGKKGWLNYITTDRMNDMDVLCATEDPEGKRLSLVEGGLLITLREDQNPNEELSRLMLVRDGARNNPTLHALETSQVFDSEGQSYINLEVFLSKAPVMD